MFKLVEEAWRGATPKALLSATSMKTTAAEIFMVLGYWFG